LDYSQSANGVETAGNVTADYTQLAPS
jgi:hypothetical protein